MTDPQTICHSIPIQLLGIVHYQNEVTVLQVLQQNVVVFGNLRYCYPKPPCQIFDGPLCISRYFNHKSKIFPSDSHTCINTSEISFSPENTLEFTDPHHAHISISFWTAYHKIPLKLSVMFRKRIMIKNSTQNLIIHFLNTHLGLVENLTDKKNISMENFYCSTFNISCELFCLYDFNVSNSISIQRWSGSY